MKSFKRVISVILAVSLLMTTLLAMPVFAEGTSQKLYVFDLESFINTLPGSKVQYDYLKLATALQGLANREKPQIYYDSFNRSGSSQDADMFWLDDLTTDLNGTLKNGLGDLKDYEQVTIPATESGFWSLVKKFSNVYEGIVLWDEKVPATANVASTIAGVEDLLPVRYAVGSFDLYTALTSGDHGKFTVKRTLVNLFDGKTIPTFASSVYGNPVQASATASTGSAKNDAYIWAVENYLKKGKTNANLMAYALDGNSWNLPDTNVTEAIGDAEIVSADFPDNMQKNSVAAFTIKIKNVGTTTWYRSQNYRLGLTRSATRTNGSGLTDDENGKAFGDGTRKVAYDYFWIVPSYDPATDTYGFDSGANDRRVLPKDVVPGDTVEISGYLRAPKTVGCCELGITMVQDGSGTFGEVYYQPIVITDDVPAKTDSALLALADDSVKALVVDSELTTTVLAGNFAGLLSYQTSGSVKLTATNTSENTWTAADYSLRYTVDGEEGTAALTEDVAPGAQTTVLIPVAAGSSADEIEITARMQNGTKGFGDVYETTVPVVNVLDSEIVDCDIPANVTEMGKTQGWVAFRNTGALQWKQSGLDIKLDGCNRYLTSPADADDEAATYGANYSMVNSTLVMPNDVYVFRFDIHSFSKASGVCNYLAVGAKLNLNLQMNCGGLSNYHFGQTQAASVTVGEAAPTLPEKFVIQNRDDYVVEMGEDFTLPDRMEPGETVNFSAAVYNAGTQTIYGVDFGASKNIYLALYDQHDGFTLGGGWQFGGMRLAEPGEWYHQQGDTSKIIKYGWTLTAPTTPGVYTVKIGWYSYSGSGWYKYGYQKTITVGEAASAKTEGGDVIRVSAPASVKAGAQFTANVTAFNSGTTGWDVASSNTDGYFLRYSFGSDSGYVKVNQNNGVVTCSGGNANYVGAHAAFAVNATAPQRSGECDLTLQMVKLVGGVETEIGEEYACPINVVADLDEKEYCDPDDISVGDKAYDAALISSVMPKAMKPGERAYMSLTYKNTGTEALKSYKSVGATDANYRVGMNNANGFKALDGASGFDNGGSSYTRINLPAGKVVASGEVFTMDAILEAPATEGEYTISFKGLREGKAWIENEAFFTIYVNAEGEAPIEVDTQKTADSSVQYGDMANTGLLNADYYIANKAFFFDLAVDETIAPLDDRSQIPGTDVDTMRTILKAQMQQAQSAKTSGEHPGIEGTGIFTVGGFVPWFIKYTSYRDKTSSLEDVDAEWRFVEIISEYGGQVDADAYGTVGLSNASVFSKVELNIGNTASKQYQAGFTKTVGDPTVTYNANTTYMVFFMGDWDGGSWLSNIMPYTFTAGTADRTNLPLTWPVNAGLAERVPQVYNYMFRNADANDFFATGDNGTGYLNLNALTDPEDSSVPTATLVDEWIAYNRQQNAKFGLDIAAFIIEGKANTDLSNAARNVIHQTTPYGATSFHDNKGGHYGLYDAKDGSMTTPFLRTVSASNQPGSENYVSNLVARMHKHKNSVGNFLSVRTVKATADDIAEIVSNYKSTYSSETVKVVDPYTFMRLYRQSQGESIDVNPDKTVDKVTYKAWDGDALPTESGNYYLTKNYTANYALTDGAKINLLLDGKSINTVSVSGTGTELTLKGGGSVSGAVTVGEGAKLTADDASVASKITVNGALVACGVTTLADVAFGENGTIRTTDLEAGSSVKVDSAQSGEEIKFVRFISAANQAPATYVTCKDDSATIEVTDDKLAIVLTDNGVASAIENMTDEQSIVLEADSEITVDAIEAGSIDINGATLNVSDIFGGSIKDSTGGSGVLKVGQDVTVETILSVLGENDLPVPSAEGEYHIISLKQNDAIKKYSVANVSGANAKKFRFKPQFSEDIAYTLLQNDVDANFKFGFLVSFTDSLGQTHLINDGEPYSFTGENLNTFAEYELSASKKVFYVTVSGYDTVDCSEVILQPVFVIGGQVVQIGTPMSFTN